MKLYERRLEFWNVQEESLLKHQGRIVFADSKSYHVKPSEFKYVLAGFKCCAECYRQVLFLQKSKWDRMRLQWMKSGGQLAEVETKHSYGERAAPVTLAIVAFLKRLEKVSIVFAFTALFLHMFYVVFSHRECLQK